jgi:hypothetical protein
MNKAESTVEDLYNLHKSGEFDSNIKKNEAKGYKTKPEQPTRPEGRQVSKAKEKYHRVSKDAFPSPDGY